MIDRFFDFACPVVLGGPISWNPLDLSVPDPVAPCLLTMATREAMVRKDLENIKEWIPRLSDPKMGDEERMGLCACLAHLAQYYPVQIDAAEGVPAFVPLLYGSDMKTKFQCTKALGYLARTPQVAQNIVSCGGREALEAVANDFQLLEQLRDKARQILPLLPAAGDDLLQKEVEALGNFSNAVQCAAAEQLGTWAAASDEKRAAIEKAGGCEALVALVVTGSDEAKWHAARALRNLANHAEAKESILKADGIAILTPIAKHGKGKVKDAASAALNLLSLVDAKAKPAAVSQTTAADIPSGEGTRVAMFSARFDGGPVEQRPRLVWSCTIFLFNMFCSWQ